MIKNDYSNLTPQLPEEGNHLIKITALKEGATKKGNKCLILDGIIVNEEGIDLDYVVIRHQYITFPKELISLKEYNELNKKFKKSKLAEEERTKYLAQKKEIASYLWKVKQFEEALGIKQPYSEVDIVGKIVRGEIVLETDYLGLQKINVKVWISPEKYERMIETEGVVFGKIEPEPEPEAEPEAAPGPEPETENTEITKNIEFDEAW